MDTRAGTIHFMAPELLKNKPYDKKCDMWSIGALTYEIIAGYPAFYADTPAKT